MCCTSDDETYTLLERNNLVVPVHLRTILSSLNYVGLQVLSKITDSDYEEITKSVIQILADPELLACKTEAELKNTFGPLYFNRPQKFTLLPRPDILRFILLKIPRPALILKIFFTVMKLQELWYFIIIEITFPFLVRQMDSNSTQNTGTAVVSIPNIHQTTMTERPSNVPDSNTRKSPPGIFCGKP